MVDLFAPDDPPAPTPRFLVDIGGMCAGAVYVPSLNCDERPDEAVINLLVVHNISLPPGEFGGNAVIELFTNRLDTGSPEAHPFHRGLAGLRVSAHFFIRRTGELFQFVPCELRAWHAGASSWNGHDRCNDFSIGVELEGTDDLAYTDEQYAVLAEVARALFVRYGILDIAGHSDIAPGRKTDPGPAFDWKRLLESLV